MALYGSASRVDCALGSRVGALGFWFLCARGRAHRCGTGFRAKDLDAVAASSTQAYSQHKLIRKFTDLYAWPCRSLALRCVASARPSAWHRTSPRRGL